VQDVLNNKRIYGVRLCV